MVKGNPNEITITGRYGTPVKLVMEQETPEYNLGEGTARGKVKLIATLGHTEGGKVVWDQAKKDLLEGVTTGKTYTSGSILGQLGYKVSRRFNVAPRIEAAVEEPATARWREMQGERAYRITLDIPDDETVAEFVAAVRIGLRRIREEMAPDLRKWPKQR